MIIWVVTVDAEYRMIDFKGFIGIMDGKMIWMGSRRGSSVFEVHALGQIPVIRRPLPFLKAVLGANHYGLGASRASLGDFMSCRSVGNQRNDTVGHVAGGARTLHNLAGFVKGLDGRGWSRLTWDFR